MILSKSERTELLKELDKEIDLAEKNNNMAEDLIRIGSNQAFIQVFLNKAQDHIAKASEICDRIKESDKKLTFVLNVLKGL